MISFEDAMIVIIYVLLAILLIALIALVIKAIKTLSKVDQMVDDVNIKINKLNGLFNIIDTTTDHLSNITDKLVEVTTSAISRFFNRKTQEREDEDNE
jgi:uncharacterized protein YoxC